MILEYLIRYIMTMAYTQDMSSHLLEAGKVRCDKAEPFGSHLHAETTLQGKSCTCLSLEFFHKG